MRLPVFQMRKYTEIFEEGCYKIIQTNRRRYVLDILDTSIGDYSDRRIEMLRRTLPYKMYPLNKRHSTIASVLSSKHKTYIDNDGRLIAWKPEASYPITCHRIVSRFVNRRGRTIFTCKDLHTKYETAKDLGYTHVQVINFKGRYLLFDLCFEEKKKTRMKI